MKLTVTLMPPFPSANGPVHLTVQHDDVESWEVHDGVLAIALGDNREAHYNWAHVRSVEVDPYGNVARPPSGLLTR